MSIVNNIRDAFTRVIEAGAGAGYLIRDALFGAPPTEQNLAFPPYTPPFFGGQCEGVTYRILYSFNEVGAPRQNGAINRVGKIKSVQNYTEGDRSGIRIVSGANDLVTDITFGLTVTYNGYSVDKIERADGQPDTCGDIPNPNPSPSIPDSGVADSARPNISGDGVTISEGLAPLPAAGALAAALAALRAALDLAAAVQAIADALQALKDLLKNKDKKDDKENVKIIQLDLGLISRDGFLRLYPSSESTKYQALYLDLQMRDIPRFFGRFFGNFSPNYFRFAELGYIAWVSPTFGVISVDSIRFSRVSLGCPDGAIGFFYHLGLNGVIKANATAFYEEELEDESE